ncbi:MAG TPA: hypothetical protein VN734_08825 [Acidobacteriaceae bacterium]|nr:hypothetical protein [Acidobacteriaceae bacterium]
MARRPAIHAPGNGGRPQERLPLGLGLGSSPDEATYTLSRNGHTSTITLEASVNGRDMHPFLKGWPSAVTQHNSSLSCIRKLYPRS